MSDDLSPVLALPLLMPAQAQKHVTHNEALRLLDVLVQPSVASRALASPPVDPQPGTRHIVGGDAVGIWAGRSGQIAFFDQGDWQYLQPRAGWRTWVIDEGVELVHDGSGWRAPADRPAQVSGLGVGTAADATNRLAVRGTATLLTHAGGSHQLKINKASSADTGCLLYQTGWSGRAELGCAGNDMFSIRVSADGMSWATALAFAPDSGIASGLAITQGPSDPTPGRLVKVGDHGLPLARPLGAGDDLDLLATSGFWINPLAGNTVGNHYPEASAGMVQTVSDGSSGRAMQIFVPQGAARPWLRSRLAAGGWGPWARIWTTAQTTVDANGFLREASPILRLLADGIEEPVQPTGARVTRPEPHHLRIHDTAGLARRGWRIEVPRDHDGVPLCVASLSEDPDGTIDLRLASPAWRAGRWQPGRPCGVPAGRWIDLRLHEPA